MITDSAESRTKDFSDMTGDDLAGDMPDDLCGPESVRELEPGERLLWLGRLLAPFRVHRGRIHRGKYGRVPPSWWEEP